MELEYEYYILVYKLKDNRNEEYEIKQLVKVEKGHKLEKIEIYEDKEK